MPLVYILWLFDYAYRYFFGGTGESLVVIGGGHAASIAVRAVSQGLINAKALAAVAPTWSGPLPIVFGRSPTMETRYLYILHHHAESLQFLVIWSREWLCFAVMVYHMAKLGS